MTWAFPMRSGALPVVEWDFTVAAYSRLLWELRQVDPPLEGVEIRFGRIARLC